MIKLYKGVFRELQAGSMRFRKALFQVLEVETSQDAKIRVNKLVMDKIAQQEKVNFHF